MGRVTLGGESGDWLQVGKWVSVGGVSESRQGFISLVAGVTHLLLAILVPQSKWRGGCRRQERHDRWQLCMGRGGPWAPGAQDRRLTGMRREVRGLPSGPFSFFREIRNRIRASSCQETAWWFLSTPGRGPKPGQPRPAP